MNAIGLTRTLGLGLVLLSTIAVKGSDVPTPTCGRHGTSVDFLDSPSEAARKARKEQKLVFVLHVSGHFEDPRFT